MREYIIGIDPGSVGYIAAYGVQSNVWTYLSIKDSSEIEIANFIKAFKGCNCVVVMEEVHSIYGSSAKSTFSFGQIFGFLRGVIVASGMPYHLVQPKEWQKEIWINADKVKDGAKVDTKRTSINAGLRLFPNIDFRRTDKCKNVDDNKVDATLIAEFARRKNL